MSAKYTLWTASLVIAIFSVPAVKRYAYFPGDVAVKRRAQSLCLRNLNWAKGISKSAELPRLWFIPAVVMSASRALAGWRETVLSIVSLAGMLALGYGFSPAIARLKPSPRPVHVATSLPGYSLCSNSFVVRWV